jgi:hypothetical protein
MTINYADHYWRVAARSNEVYSSARASYVPLDDPDYRIWSGARVSEWEIEFSSRGQELPLSIADRASGVGLASEIPTEEEMIAILFDHFPAGSPVKAWTPDEIVAAVMSVDEDKANAILSGVSEVQKLQFQRAQRVREDNAQLVAVLASADISINDLKAAIAAL